jgi:SpoVK/Ycf46/Vps4 family AAA+-type ATPase
MIKTALQLLGSEKTLDDLDITKKASKQIASISELLKNKVRSKRDFRDTNKISELSPVLFYGTQTAEQRSMAALIGNLAEQPAYRMDLSNIVSKHIGETEKNLDALFDAAEKKDAVLFFDEAEALFGKRTDVKDAHDKYANLDTAYLLQRMESYQGLVLISSNRKTSLDPAFLRRLRYTVHFQKPRKKKSG